MHVKQGKEPTIKNKEKQRFFSLFLFQNIQNATFHQQIIKLWDSIMT